MVLFGLFLAENMLSEVQWGLGPANMNRASMFLPCAWGLGRTNPACLGLDSDYL